MATQVTNGQKDRKAEEAWVSGPPRHVPHMEETSNNRMELFRKDGPLLYRGKQIGRRTCSSNTGWSVSLFSVVGGWIGVVDMVGFQLGSHDDLRRCVQRLYSIGYSSAGYESGRQWTVCRSSAGEILP